MWSEPTLVQRAEQPYVAITVRVPMDKLGEVVPPLNGAVFEWIADNGGQPSGPPFWKYNVIDMERELEIEAGVAVQQPMPGSGRVSAGVLPGGTYASLLHTGHPQELVDATGALLDWAAGRGLAWDVVDDPAGERWAARLELYRTDPSVQPDMAKWETELAFRVKDSDGSEA
ncbi:GyrI-like domain-containing protein [Microlunatus soli]|uniref:Effector-binding domain-containing protein n=1 Tax=Microlunatus soli TaxID=630515 RepID=A0A1H1VLP1_9ACTN|nr:GyrI-like domain-containing protein [Microlunatus soli]SDS85788.1 effector-binding domain-containing protein [Microlunatus soli]